MQVTQTNECQCDDANEVALVLARLQNIGSTETLVGDPIVDGLKVTFVVTAQIDLS